MVKHTQAIRQQKPTNCLSMFDHSLGLELKGLGCNNTMIIPAIQISFQNLQGIHVLQSFVLIFRATYSRGSPYVILHFDLF